MLTNLFHYIVQNLIQFLNEVKCLNVTGYFYKWIWRRVNIALYESPHNSWGGAQVNMHRLFPMLSRKIKMSGSPRCPYLMNVCKVGQSSISRVFWPVMLRWLTFYSQFHFLSVKRWKINNELRKWCFFLSFLLECYCWYIPCCKLCQIFRKRSLIPNIAHIERLKDD